MEQLIVILRSWLTPVLSILIAYIIGSFPTSYLIGRIFYKTDIRESGSGNSGATNTLRTFGAKAGIAVLIIDVLKGVLAIIIAQKLAVFSSGFYAYNIITSTSALAVILGHIYSIFLKFKGGKGVATTAGVFMTLMPVGFVYCVVLFVLIVYITKYVSLGSITAGIAFLFIEFISQYIIGFHNVPRLIMVIVVVGMILLKHKANLQRLYNGTENKVSFKKKTIQE